MKVYAVSVSWNIPTMYGKFSGEKFVGVYSSKAIAKRVAKKAMIQTVDQEVCYTIRPSQVTTYENPENGSLEHYYASGEVTIFANVWAECIDSKMYN